MRLTSLAPRPGQRRPRRRWLPPSKAGATLVAGVASLVSSGPATIVVTATDAAGGTPAYTYQWQRSSDSGPYENLSNGGGVSGATTLTLTDGSASAGVLYEYRLAYGDAAAGSATSNVVTAEAYSGGAISGGGGSIFQSSVIRGV